MRVVGNRKKQNKKKHGNASQNQSMMTTFNFYFGCTLGEQLLRQNDNLGRAMHNSSTSAAQGILEVSAYRQDYFAVAEKISIFQEQGSQGIAKTSLGVE